MFKEVLNKIKEFLAEEPQIKESVVEIVETPSEIESEGDHYEDNELYYDMLKSRDRRDYGRLNSTSAKAKRKDRRRRWMQNVDTTEMSRGTAQIVEMFVSGASLQKIADTMGMSRKKLSKILDKLVECNKPKRNAA